MSNRLRGQSSPYLLQHADNPVDWYPWGQEAFEKAEREGKPIFLSVGYSTCHWCHVMAHESFENEEIAGLLNRDFVSVKVDREERPDIDSVYMTVCQAMTGSGGWPMSIFMTPDQKPFFAGTYFPPESRYGMMGFRELLLLIAERWKSNRAELVESAGDILTHINTGHRKVWEGSGRDLPKMAAQSLSRSFDEKNGGFGEAPKFPMPHNLIFLTLYSQIYHDEDALRQVTKTLEQMRRGGIFDQIGYGFSRYSTDSFYLVPHFEKMLYDNALLMIAYCAAYKACQKTKTSLEAEKFLDTAVKTAEYVFQEMTGGDGEFYSAQDADSEGQEGRYYVWDYGEICEILGEEKGRTFCEYFGITPQGNFEGKNIPNLLNGNEFSDDFERERRRLYTYRKERAKLHLDNKVLTSWNALMIYAMSVLYRVTGEKCYLLAAQKAQGFIENNLAEDNILYVSCRGTIRSVKGFLEDYAYYTAALISLYDVTSEEAYLQRAEQICREAGRQFFDENGGYFLYGSENSSLITRPKETYDGALPSGNSVMAYCLVRLSLLTEKEEYRKQAEKQLAFLSAEAQHYPAGYGMFLVSLLLHSHPFPQITVVLSETDSADNIIARLPLGADVRFLEREAEGYKRLDGKTTYYVCKDHVCQPPMTDISRL